MGIDPGSKGFITIYHDGNWDFYPMPQEKIETGELSKTGKPKMKTQFSESGLRDLVFKINSKYKGRQFVAAIEDVHGREGWSAQNNFSFGYTAGMQKMVAVMLNAEIVMVRPQKWQSAIYRGHDIVKVPSSTGKTMVNDAKATSLKVAQSLFPGIDLRKDPTSKRSSIPDDNKVDSLLICEYLRRSYRY